ncbi:MAG: TonB-dependent receptor [Gammaproteobacteria bacterium]
MLTLIQRFSPVRGTIATVLAAVTAVSAMAPSIAATRDELITTTARGRTEAVQDVPASIAVISTDDIQALGVERVEDFVDLVPGVTIVDAAEVGDTQINIRGINGTRDAENSIALVIDGVLMTNPAAVNREYTNLDQIEVLKGPQGALYGRNAAAGAIIIRTQPPGEELSAKLKGSVAEDTTYTLVGNVSGPAGDSAAWSLGADYRTSDGFYRDSFNGCDNCVDDFEGWNIDGRLVLDLTDNWSLDAKARFGEVDAASITFNSVFHIPSLVGLLINGFGFPANLAAFGNEDVNGHDFRFNPNVFSFNEQDSVELSLKSDTDLGWADLTAWVLYSDIDNNLGADGTSGAFGFFFQEPLCRSSTASLAGSPLNPPQAIGPTPEFSLFGAYTPTTCDGTQYQERNQQDVSFEMRLASKSDQRLRWSAGFYYLNIDREVGVNTGVDSGNGIVKSLFVPNGGVSGVNNATEQLVHDQFDSDVYAVFGQLAYDFLDTLEGSVALRYDREERDARSLVDPAARSEFIACDGSNASNFTDPINPGLCNGPLLPQSKTFSELQPKVALTWDIRPTLTAFATVGVGFKSGGFNNQGSKATVDNFINGPLITNPGAPFAGQFAPVGIEDQYKKETSTSYELGFKSQIGDFSWEGALYHIDVEDMQFFEFFVGGFGLLRVVSNVDEVDMDGIELTGTWAATDWLNLFAGGNWIDSEIKKNRVRPESVGNESPYTPEYTFNLGGNATFPITSGLNLLASVDVTGVGETWFHVMQNDLRPTIFTLSFGLDEGDTSLTKRDSYVTVNARIGVGGENWSVVAFGRNITDEDYLEEVIPAPEFGGSFDHPGTRSRFGVEATYRF